MQQLIQEGRARLDDQDPRSYLFKAPDEASRTADTDTLNEMASQAQALAKTGLPRRSNELSASTSSVVRFRLTGQTVFTYSFTDEQGNNVDVALDHAGRKVDLQDFADAEFEAYTEAFGKVHPDLTLALDAAPADALLPLAAWVFVDEDDRPTRAAAGHSAKQEYRAMLQDLEEDISPSAEAVDVLINKLEIERADTNSSAVATLIADLADLGIQAEQLGDAPLVTLEATPDIVAFLEHHEDVETVYLHTDAEPELEVARQAVRAHTVHNRGINGSGVKVAVIESGGGRVHTDNPFLAATNDGLYSCWSSHGTAVAGVIRSTDSDDRGIAPACQLRVGGACNGSGSRLMSRSTAAANWGARVMNLSWGSYSLVPGVLDRFYDDLMYDRRILVVKSAGNEAGSCRSRTGQITSPGLGFNVLTVGNFNDRGSSSTSDDIMSSCSSFRDPLSMYNDREKPEVAAPGTNITATRPSSPWIGSVGSGTSLAAPVVTGIAALIIDRQPVLATLPETIKSIIITTALNNIEGSSRLSDKDGAGGVHARAADDIARFDNGGWAAKSYDCSRPTYWNAKTVYLQKDKRARISIVWGNDTGSSANAQWSMRPHANLNLQIVAPGGNVVRSSNSRDNTYEIVDFTPSVSGHHVIRIHKKYCNPALDPNIVGISWYQYGL